MYDPYPAHPTLRLGPNLQEVKSRHEERADIRRQIDALWARYCDLTMLMESEHKQSMPISAQRLTCWGDADDPLWQTQAGEQCSTALSDNDFWDQRHRSLIQAAASGEIRDPAESLRHSHMMHEPLYEDDGA